MLGDESTTPRVVVQVGGRDALRAIDSSLNAPTPEALNQAFDGVES